MLQVSSHAIAPVQADGRRFYLWPKLPRAIASWPQASNVACVRGGLARLP
jgi:hypothetical protein